VILIILFKKIAKYFLVAVKTKGTTQSVGKLGRREEQQEEEEEEQEGGSRQEEEEEGGSRQPLHITRERSLKSITNWWRSSLEAGPTPPSPAPGIRVFSLSALVV